MPSMKITVVMGGPSGEHDISLQSGQGVAAALGRRGFLVEPVVIPRTPNLAQACEVTRAALMRAHPDVVFIALHGAFGEDGTIQRLCDERHLAYTGSDPLASRLGMDKVASRRRFSAAGLTVPPCEVVDMSAGATPLTHRSYPVVVKPASQGSSLGVSIVQRPEELDSALAEAARYDQTVLIEEFIRGRELTVGVLGDQPLPVIEIRPRQPFFDFTAKYTPGLTDYLVPAPLEPTIARMVQAAAMRAHEALGCRHLSRTDLILTPPHIPVILEVNTIPGFTPTSLLPKAAACLGLSYEEVCERLVHLAWSDHARGSPPLHESVATTSPSHV